MPRKDLYHDVVVEALQREGWKITDDPLWLSIGGTDLFVDLAAERVLGASKGDVKIAVEIKSFVGASKVDDLEMAVGQYNVYRDVLAEIDADRIMYLAIPSRIEKDVFSSPLGRLISERQHLMLIVFDEKEKRELVWLPNP